MIHHKYHIVGMGGTFDRFHIGHQHFLQFASQLADELYIGITVPEMVKAKSLETLIESYKQRLESVRHYLEAEKIPHKLFPLTDVYGQTLEGSPVDGVCVTEATVRGGEEINRKRAELGLSELPVHVCSLLKDVNGQPISSTRIREGEISRAGTVYTDLFQQTCTLQDNHRQFFAEKQGGIINLTQYRVPSVSFPQRVCVVGDQALETFLHNEWGFDVGIYDGVSQRTPYRSFLPPKMRVNAHVINPPGRITTQLVQAVKESLLHREVQVIKVEGEEDLAAVALVLLLPLGSVVYYGQPHEGIVETRVTEELKEAFYKVLTA